MNIGHVGDIILLLGIVVGSAIFIKCNCDYLPKEKKEDEMKECSDECRSKFRFQ